MKIKIFLLSILVLLSTACNKNNVQQPDPNPEQEINNVASQTIESFVHDGVTRKYILYIPASYNATSEVPLLFNFHGFGGDMSDYIDYADLRAVADTENFILVYPQGTLIEGISHWNPSLASPDNKSTADDLGFIEALIGQLSSDYKIDNERIYACGYSNGAMMSYGLAAHKSELIAAVGSVSGVMLDEINPSHPMPVIIIHGTSDGVLPYNGSSDYNSIESVLNFWINFNNTNKTPVQNSEIDNGTTVEHYLYDQGNNDISVEHYKIIDGDHVWFKINYKGADTGSLVWDFFSKYDINGLR